MKIRNVLVFKAALAAGGFLFAQQVFAGPCEEDVTKIEAALKAQGDLAADVRTQAEDMVKQAKDLCAAGNESEGLAVTSEARSLLSIE